MPVVHITLGGVVGNLERGVDLGLGQVSRVGQFVKLPMGLEQNPVEVVVVLLNGLVQ